jgi:hypothetical protein
MTQPCAKSHGFAGEHEAGRPDRKRSLFQKSAGTT